MRNDSLRFLQPFPFHHPASVVGKAGRVFVGCAVSAGGHHCDGVKQAAVAEEIPAAVETFDIVAVLRIIARQGIDGDLRLPRARCTHGELGEIPAPAQVLSRPHLGDRTPWDLGIHSFDGREHAEDTSRIGMLVAAFRVGVSILPASRVDEQATDYGQRREVPAHFIPMRIPLETATLPPFLRLVQGPAPITRCRG